MAKNKKQGKDIAEDGSMKSKIKRVIVMKELEDFKLIIKQAWEEEEGKKSFANLYAKFAEEELIKILIKPHNNCILSRDDVNELRLNLRIFMGYDEKMGSCKKIAETLFRFSDKNEQDKMFTWFTAGLLKETNHKFDNEVKNTIKKNFRGFIKNRIITLTLPDNFEGIIHKNIKFSKIEKPPYFKIALPDFSSIREALIEEFERIDSRSMNQQSLMTKNDKESFLHDSKIMRAQITLKVGFICSLLECVFNIIDIYFPIEKYGFPEQDLLVIIMGLIMKDDVCFTVLPYIFDMCDPHGLLLKRENMFLREVIDRNNIDIKKEEITTGFTCEQHKLLDILMINRKHYIRVEPDISGREIKSVIPELKVSMEKIERYRGRVNINTNRHLNEFINQAQLYIDRYVSKKKNPNEIQVELEKEYANKGACFTAKDDQIRKDIKKLLEDAGFQELYRSNKTK